MSVAGHEEYMSRTMLALLTAQVRCLSGFPPWLITDPKGQMSTASYMLLPAPVLMQTRGKVRHFEQLGTR